MVDNVETTGGGDVVWCLQKSEMLSDAASYRCTQTSDQGKSMYTHISSDYFINNENIFPFQYDIFDPNSHNDVACY